MKRWISILLVLTMVFSLGGGLGLGAYADEADEAAALDAVEDSAEVTEEDAAVAEEPVDVEEPAEEPVDVEEPAEETVAEEEISTDGESDAGDPYVVIMEVTAGNPYVLAYQDDAGTYYVLEDTDHGLVVTSMESLTTATVTQSMLWTVTATIGADALVGAAGDYLYADEDGLAVTSSYTYGWDYYSSNLWFTDWADHMYLASIPQGKIVFYAPDNGLRPRLKASAVTATTSNPATGEGEDGHSYLVFASDRHGVATQISRVMGGSQMPSSVEYVGLIGDMVDATDNFNTSDVLEEVNGVFPHLTNDNVAIVYGSHDAGANDNATILKCKAPGSSDLIYAGYDTDNGKVAYYIYAIAFDDMVNDTKGGGGAAPTQYNEATVKNRISEFEAWVDEVDVSIPIIVVCHAPIHAARGDNPGAPLWNKALNYAATGYETPDENAEVIRNVVFLHGHNHTTSKEEFYCAPKEKINIPAKDKDKTGTRTTIYYTYITAGYLRDNSTATLIDIGDDTISFTKYTSGSPAALGTVDRVKAACTVTFDTDGDYIMVEVPYGSLMERPEDPTRDGFTFVGWYLDGEEYDFSTPVTSDISLIAKWEADDEDSPVFKTHSLVLSGQIGVNFYMSLPEIEGVNYSDSYMEFTVNEKTTKDVFDEGHMNASGKYYGFTCYVNSIQMAEKITAVFHYGDGQTIEQTYSIQEYLETFETNSSSFDESTTALIHAIADYGHYVQPFLSAARGWTLGEDYAEMTTFYAESYDIDAIKTAVNDYAIVRETGVSDIAKITYSLSLDTSTSINVYLAPKSEDYTGEIKVTIDGTEAAAEKQSDGRYRVSVPNISAHQLGVTHTIIVTTDSGTAEVEVSAMSYVQTILNAEAYANNTVAQNAVASLYHYYMAVEGYRSQH